MENMSFSEWIVKLFITFVIAVIATVGAVIWFLLTWPYYLVRGLARWPHGGRR